ncbi:MAG: cell division protein DivIVA [Cellulomonas sp. 73-145]|uniref:DivIVA domain-containing protein n=1 Tax=Cellulomonas sp. 73-145 TaxID=1895739 RepID=UPI00092A0C8F|nr:DivIVA domain-containing protein [Cellulomonas sp. 73-145]MBN9325725.1 DivIVA domain-containing protein [Cellulomonas sp.]OJV59858.1 MAG: cell division protein DivIVA [Cellulomonas sp. 73-145]
MALLTADDVLNKKFQSTKFREGYDQDEVDDFLDEIVNTLREVQNENEDLKTKLAAAERRIAELSRTGVQQQPPAPKPEPAPAPEPVQAPAPAPVAAVAPPIPAVTAQAPRNEPESATGMLALAQKLHDDYVRSGQEESDRLINEAKSRATHIVREAEETSQRTLGQLEQERSLLERKIDELRVFERDYRTRLKSYLENLLGDLDNRGNALPPRSGQAQPVGEVQGI